MNAVIYARYSSDSQREESIEGQLRECREYAERNNMTIVGTYIDRALSAKTADRPEFQHMIKDSAKELFEIVLVWKLDRFSRDQVPALCGAFLPKYILRCAQIQGQKCGENAESYPRPGEQKGIPGKGCRSGFWTEDHETA